MDSIREFLEQRIWSDRAQRLGPLGRIASVALRYAYALLRDIVAGDLSLRAMSLVYTTLLSIIPLLAFSFAILKGLGVFEQLEPYIADALEPLGSQGDEITRKILELVDNVKGGVLGGVSMVILLWTVTSTIQKIEASFNFVWYVARARSFARRFSEYLVVLIVGPILMVAALSIIGTMGSSTAVKYVQSLPGTGALLLAIGTLAPYFLIGGVFTFLYMFIPNTKVRLKSAFVGGLGGGVLWATMAKAFTTFVITATQTQNIYANFAVAIFALIWLYLNWLVLLIGAQLAFYHQNPVFLRIGRQEPKLSNAMTERLALNLMVVVGQAFREGRSIVGARDVGAALNIPTVAITPISAALEQAGILALTDKDSWVPGREMSRIALRDILDVVRLQGDTGSHGPPTWSRDVDVLGGEVDKAVSATVGTETLAAYLDRTTSSTHD